MLDTYQTIASSGEACHTEKRSRFLAFAHHVTTVDEAKAIIASYRKKYFDARHVCYAYTLGYDSSITRQNDDGEPSGSAGKPIGGQLRSANVTNAIVLVVRYFGGVKLGTGGLAVAYKTAAAEALASAIIEERIIMKHFIISAPYAEADIAMRYVRDTGAQISRREYTATDVILNISVRLSDENILRSRLTNILSLRFIDKDPPA